MALNEVRRHRTALIARRLDRLDAEQRRLLLAAMPAMEALLVDDDELVGFTPRPGAGSGATTSATGPRLISTDSTEPTTHSTAPPTQAGV